ncbi:hypothetical protein HHL16_21150 [Pseudoflavitalea sp. G-6-1-2]|uniref:hypothetical protein n=1 Tax=Pseudoflavitalea sp. G-6-1-2 TaxID=2728841 RepID=UPI00146B0CAB|nr:hypothetical protein [Pseudoflavitalea sp. G-6-1-2]NML23401.1 hypothetical protein [Pseudoflavitalea sp. G-6-1-2]
MNNETAHIWNQLNAFPFDAPNLIERFSDRLANQENWTKEYTAEVIEEFKRFLFLITIEKESMLVPPPDVELAWETYEGFYPLGWKELCTQVLLFKKPLIKYSGYNDDEGYYWLDEYYADTINKYQKVFSAIPPKEIWPSADELPGPFQIVQMRGNSWKQNNLYWWLIAPLFIFIPLLGHFISASFLIFIMFILVLILVIFFVRSGGRNSLRPTSYYDPEQFK